MKTILVIGGEPAAGLELKQALEQVGHLVVVVEGAADGLNALDQFHVDVVIVDVRRVDDDGLATIAAIAHVYPRARIVALADGQVPAALAAGAHQTLTRPIAKRDLLKAVGCRVLVVDDEPDIRLALTRVLEKAGFEVRTAANGIEGLEHLRAQGTEMVITDIVMPRVNGIDLIGTLVREMPQVRIVAISGGGVHGAGLELADVHATSACLSAARGAGAHRVLTKPFGVKDILSAVGLGGDPA